MYAYQKGLVETYKRLVEMSKKMGDLHPVFKHILKDFFEANRNTFESEGLYLLGERWSPLNPTYEKAKKQRWGARPILVASGRLKRSLTESDPELNEVIIENTSFKFVSKVTVNGRALWKLHQRGTRKMPARPIIDFKRFRYVTRFVITQYIRSKSLGGFEGNG